MCDVLLIAIPCKVSNIMGLLVGYLRRSGVLSSAHLVVARVNESGMFNHLHNVYNSPRLQWLEGNYIL